MTDETHTDYPDFVIYMIRTCITCDQDAVTNKEGFCPRCARENP